MRRSEFLRGLVLGGATLAVDRAGFARALSAACSSAEVYGPLGAPDSNGIRLPAGFRSRVIAKAGTRVTGTSYVWHKYPDGGANFPLADGGWAYVSNSEVGSGAGGASSIRFDAAGRIVRARRLLAGTSRNCSGGPTPWGTWLSCEEVSRGRVYEVDPLGMVSPVRRSALGRFRHEAAGVDAARKTVYLTEDEPDGKFYRFRYSKPANLSAGLLEVAIVGAGGSVAWTKVPDPSGAATRTRYQVPTSTPFSAAEGAWFASDVLYFTTKGDNKVWAFDVVAQRLSVIYDASTSCHPVLTGVDNVTASRSGDVYVAEDGGDMQLVLLGTDGSISPVLQITNQAGSELAGPAFNPAGDRLYLSSQRGGSNGHGITYEISGPFRT